MVKLIKKHLVVFLALYAALGVLQLRAETAPTEPAGGVVRATLENGLRVVIVPNNLAPVATTVINYLVGSNEAPAGFPGTAHALEHMMFRGSPGLSAAQLADLTASMGGNFNADTQQTVTQYYFTVPAADLDISLRIEATRLRGLLTGEDLWNQERGAIEQEVAQDLSNPQYVFYTRLLAALFKNTPYAHDALGTKPSFDRTNAALLKNFYETWYVPNNAILIIAGRVEPEKTLGLVKELFGPIPKKELPPREPIRLEPVTPENLQLKTDLPVGLVACAFRFPGYESPDYAASKVLADILDSQRGDLFSLAALGKALDTSFDLITFPQTGLGLATAAFPKDGDANALLQQVQATLRDWVQQGFDPDLVTAAKKRAAARLDFSKGSVSGLAQAWSEALAIEGYSSPEDLVKAIDKVTPADVDRVARLYLDFKQSVTGILTPSASGKPVSTGGFGRKESIQIKATEKVALPEWASQLLQNPTVPALNLNPVDTRLPNGLRIIVQPESVNNEVVVYGEIKHQSGMQEPQGQEGVNKVLEQLLPYGTTSLDRLAFQKALDDIAAETSTGTTFTLKVPAENFERGVQLLADNQLHPALPEKDFLIVRTQVSGMVAGELQSPDFLAKQGLKAALYPKGDPTLRHPTPQSVQNLSLQNVQDYFHQVFRPDKAIIVVIGRVSPEKAVAAVSAAFGSWEAFGPPPNTLLPPVPPNKPAMVTIPDASRIQDKVLLAQNLGFNRFSPDYYAVKLGNHVLGGGFYATRLYQALREKTGLVYHVGVDLEANQTRGLYDVEYGCDPANVSRTRTIVLSNLIEMMQHPVRDEELLQAKSMLIKEITLSESSLTHIAAGYLQRAVLDLPLQEPLKAAEHYLGLNPEQVQAAFAKWVQPTDLVEIIQGPPAK